jgi:aminopeptidase N
LLVLFALHLTGAAHLQAQDQPVYTRADTLRGSYTTPWRAWWDVTFYDLHVAIQPADSSIRGHNAITYRVLEPASELQIDLQTPLEVDSMVQDGRSVSFRREGNAFFATVNAPQPKDASKTITVYYHGKPVVARDPPWEGGFIWASDTLGQPWIATSTQGIGASAWWPNKDIGADEPDSQRVATTVPQPMINVSNGRLRSTTSNPDGTTTYEWFVTDPINNYGIAINAGSYAHYTEIYQGERGELTLDFWPLSVHLAAAKQQFTQVRPTLQCFEHWFGPFPWYEDGFKLIETSHLGMEHQSAVAYGNRYQNGYRGMDLSGTGHGLKWDYIIVHETAHEWFANSISAKDQADLWVHESFASYAEGLFTECLLGKEAGAAYMVGTRSGIRNDRPIIPAYGVNAEGSDDMYHKGANLLHMMRHIIGDDVKWRALLRALNETFRHQTVTGQQIEAYLSAQSGVDFSKVFDQYLRTTKIPVLEYRIQDSKLSYRWNNVVPGFDMPVAVTVARDSMSVIRPTEAWQTTPLNLPAREFRVDANYYVNSARIR